MGSADLTAVLPEAVLGLLALVALLLDTAFAPAAPGAARRGRAAGRRRRFRCALRAVSRGR